VLPVVSYIQASTEDDGSAFKLLINEAIGGLPALPKDMEKNNDSIYTNHQGAERIRIYKSKITIDSLNTRKELYF